LANWDAVGVIGQKELMDALRPGFVVRHSPYAICLIFLMDSYIGWHLCRNAVSCTAAVAVADAIREEHIPANVKEVSVCHSVPT